MLELPICHQSRGGRVSFSTIISPTFRPPSFPSSFHIPILLLIVSCLSLFYSFSSCLLLFPIRSLLELSICHQSRGGRDSFSTIISPTFRPPSFPSSFHIPILLIVSCLSLFYSFSSCLLLFPIWFLLELPICHQSRGGRDSFSTIISPTFRPPSFPSSFHVPILLLIVSCLSLSIIFLLVFFFFLSGLCWSCPFATKLVVDESCPPQKSNPHLLHPLLF